MTEIHFFGLNAAQIGLIIVLLAPLSLQLVAIADVARSDFRGNAKLLWLLVLIVLPLVGFLLYFPLGRKQKVRRTGPLAPPEA